MTFTQIEQSKNYIESVAKLLGTDVEAVCKSLLQCDVRFLNWSGSSRKETHHYGWGGLVVHTSEVIKVGLECQTALGFEMDKKEFFFAALFHDTGKMYDYVPLSKSHYDEWTGTAHKRLIHHISRSALYWNDVIVKHPTLYDKYYESVLHAILAHHGQREWGSPIAPKTRVAWLLHLSDSISARMNDCDTLDVVHIPK